MHVIFPVGLTLYPHSEFSYFVEIIPETLCRMLDWACYDGYHEIGKLYQNDILGVWERHADVYHTEPDSVVLALDEHSVTSKGYGRWFPQDTTRIRVLGNAYDNPELLHGQDLNRFINGLREYDGSSEDYIEEHKYLTSKYNIHGAQACCYLCNFENDYICHQYNDGCSSFEVCKYIRDNERLNKEK